MLVVHPVWSLGRGLCLWAEDPAGPRRSPGRDRGRARPHPFAADAAALADAAARAAVTASPGLATLLLPSGPDGPTPSPRLDEAPDGGEAAAWVVPVLEVEAAPSELLPLLSTADDPTRVLRALEDVAAALVARGRVVPVIGEQARSWRPVLQGPDLVVADGLAAALPPSLRCEADAGGGSADPGPADAGTVAAEALAHWVDRYARRAAGPVDADPALGVLAGADAEADPTVAGTVRAAMSAWAVEAAPHAGPGRLLLRLDEPAVDALGHALDEPVFRLELALAAPGDPSLHLTAAAIWRDPGALRRWLDDPAAVLVDEIDRAGAAWAPLAVLRRTPRPTGLDLDPVEAHEFLVAGASALRDAGFVVLVPDWSTRPGTLGLAGRADPARVRRTSRVGREALVAFSWRLTVDGAEVTDEEMTALAAAKAPLVRLRGRWVRLDECTLRAGLRHLAALADAPGLPAGDAADLALGRGDRGPRDWPLPVVSLTAPGALGALLSGSGDDGLPEHAPPTGLGVALRPYQRRGVAWLRALADLGLGGVLADDMGLGKTVQVLALEAAERDGAGTRADAGDPAPTLVVCPTSVVGTWAREAARAVPALRVRVHHGPARADAIGDLAAADLVVTSYGTLVRDAELLGRVGFARLVLDEAQAVKNPRSRAARAARAVPARHRLALTGTPVENRLAELWAILDAVEPGLLGDAASFRDEFAVPVERHGDVAAAARLRRRTRPLILRRTKSDPRVVDDLPAAVEIVERCFLTTEQASLYRASVDRAVGRVRDLPDGARRRGRVLAALTELKQVCDHPALLLADGSPLAGRSGKLARLEEILDGILAAGERALLFTQYAAFGAMLAPYLAERFGVEVAWLHGGTPRAERDRLVAAFQAGLSEEGTPPVFLASLRAGGTGLTLTAAAHVIHLDRWWNPAVEDQATDRAVRLGQHRVVTVRRLVCAGTLEDRIDEVLRDKRGLADLVVRPTDGPDPDDADPDSPDPDGSDPDSPDPDGSDLDSSDPGDPGPDGAGLATLSVAALRALVDLDGVEEDL